MDDQEPEERTLLQLFRCREDWDKAVVLKNLPDDLDLDRLVNFLDIVIDEDGDLEAICPSIGAPAIIAIFNKPIKNTDKYHHTLEKKTLKGNRVVLSKLGEAKGIFLPLIPQVVAKDYIELYFESKKQCGAECEVMDVRFSQTGSRAAVTISDKAAISVILEKQDHVMRKRPVSLEPYFPEYHDYILDHVTDHVMRTDKDIIDATDTDDERNECGKESKSHDSIVIYKRDKTKTFGEREEMFKADGCTGKSALIDVAQCGVLKVSVTEQSLNGTGSSEEKTFIQEDVKKEVEKRQTSERFEPVSHKERHSIQQLEEIFPQHCPRHFSSSLDIKKSETVFATNSVSRTKESVPQSNSPLGLQDSLPGVLPKTKARAKLSDCLIEGHENTVTAMQKGFAEEKPTVSPEAQPMSEFNLLLGPRGVEKEFADTDESRAEDEVIKVGGRGKAEAKVKPIPRRESVTERHTGSGSNMSLISDHDKIQVACVELNGEQKDLTNGQKWTTFVTSLTGMPAVMRLSKDGSKVMVEGLNGKVVAQVKQKVLDFLKDNVARDTTEFELNGAQAKCFQTCLQQDLEKNIRGMQGTMEVEVVKKYYPMKLSLTVEGDVSVKEEMVNCLKQIWHEQFDFGKVSSSDLDQWLLMKGLNGEHGRRFFKRFQQDHSCFIDVTPEGQIAPPPIERKE